MKRVLKTAEIIFIFSALCIAFSFLSAAEDADGWYESDEGTYYYRDGKAETGLVKIGEYTYYFGNDGIMQTGWVDFPEGKRRFHMEHGAMLRGRKKVEEKFYWFNYNGLMKEGWIKAFGKKYYCDEPGEAVTGWKKINGKHYYFNTKGEMLKNQIADSYYLLSDGTRAESPAVKKAARIVNAVTKDNMTKKEKLYACYNYIVRNFEYERDYTNVAYLKGNWPERYAQYAFDRKLGNCYKYASAMGYCAAILGYKVNIAYGKIASGYSMTGHGWTEIKSGKNTYILDTVQEKYSKGDFYMRSYSSYPKKLQKISHKAIVLS